MKKNYITPEVRCQNTATATVMMAGSINLDKNGTATINIGGDTVDDTEFDARDNGIWGEEW